MSLGTSGSTSVYLPLPQSNTDSDSEEELHSGRENHSNRTGLINSSLRALPVTEIPSHVAAGAIHNKASQNKN